MVMKKITLVILFVAVSLAVMAQEESLLRKGFSVGANYTHVKNRFWETTNYSIGIFGEYEHPIIKKLGLSGVATAGIDRIQDCRLCETGWYTQPIWWGFALKRPFQIENQHFSIQARLRWFGFARSEPISRNANGEFTDWWDGKNIIKVFGFRFGYQIPVELPLELTYSHETNAFFRLNTFGLAWQF